MSFTTHIGSFQYNNIPFGFRKAPETFQRAIHIILSGVRWKTCLVYIYDVIVFSPIVQELLKHMEQVLGLLQYASIYVKLRKCEIFRDKVTYLVRTIMPGKRAAKIDTSSAIHKATFPSDKKKRESFLGACNVYLRFIKDF